MELIIPTHNYTKREITVVDILKLYPTLTSFLNIGFHNWEDPRNHWWINICNRNGIDWKIMEIFPPNIDRAIKAGCPSDRIFHGDILDHKSYGKYDCIMFWHGPEHIHKLDWLNNIQQIESHANKLVIFGMPLGEEPQGAVYGNPAEEHVSAWEPNEWESLGYTCTEVHDRVPAHFTAFKKI